MSDELPEREPRITRMTRMQKKKSVKSVQSVVKVGPGRMSDELPQGWATRPLERLPKSIRGIRRASTMPCPSPSCQWRG